ncbi:CBS domain-containing protein [Bremerella sp. JC770]|uniref:CBS domain-containing protein n=1 Tax=Bremerella sp. JC770 TaxID=3232137 RepID=UPI003457C1C2
MIVSQSFLSRGLDTLITFNPISVHENVQLDELLERLYSTGFHHWPVVDDQNHIVGMISDQDIVRAATERYIAHASLEQCRLNYQVPVTSFMKRNVQTIDESGSPRDALSQIIERGVHCLPVTKQGTLWGMVTTTDFVREFAYSSHVIGEIEVGQAYDSEPELVETDTPIDEVRKLFIESTLSYVLVVQGDCPLGVITARDLRRHCCRQMARSLFDGQIGETSQAIDLLKTTSCLQRDSNLGYAATMMYEQQLNAIMVCPRGEDKFGVITEAEILRRICEVESVEQPDAAGTYY